jgi:hypothetical protein
MRWPLQRPEKTQEHLISKAEIAAANGVLFAAGLRSGGRKSSGGVMIRSAISI